MSKPIEKRYEFVLFFDVENGNPNGDPDAGNLPRIDPETGLGIVTDVCLKRKVRNYVELAKENNEGYNIYVREGAVLNNQHLKAYEANPDIERKSKKLPAEAEKAHRIKDFMCQNFYDIRTFGAVMTTEVNCGQVRGPVQFTFARSLDPIIQQEVTITRMAVTKESEADKERTMGRKYIVPYGLYRVEGFISAPLAEKTGFLESDLELLWESLISMFEHDRSAARGKMASRKLYVFEHEGKMGNAPAHKLFDLITVNRTNMEQPPRSFKDYQFSFSENDLPQGVVVRELI